MQYIKKVLNSNSVIPTSTQAVVHKSNQQNNSKPQAVTRPQQTVPSPQPQPVTPQSNSANSVATKRSVNISPKQVLPPQPQILRPLQNSANLPEQTVSPVKKQYYF